MIRKRHILLLAIGVITLLTACAKTELSSAAYIPNAGEVQFMAAKYATKGGSDSNGSEFKGSSFGAYAWASSKPGYYMDNLEMIKKIILHEHSAWAPRDTSIYWPSTGTVDFICYYPWVTEEHYVNIEPNRISYTEYNVKVHNQTDLMYANKAVGYSFVPDQAEEKGYTSVPAIFNHALAKVGIQIAQNYRSKTEEGSDGKLYTTHWEVRIDSARFVGAAASGSAVFTMPEFQPAGLVTWIKPFKVKMIDDEPVGYYVWTPGAHNFDDALAVPPEGITLDILHRNEGGYITHGFTSLMPSSFMIPQLLESGKQTLKLNATIRTQISDEEGNILSSNVETIENNIDLLIPHKVEAWQINQSTTYYIMLSPTSSNGNGGASAGDPLSPGYPVNPDDPDLSDGSISFHPVVENNATASAGY